MKEINHECYVSLEGAKLLKEAGFDWKCINRYIKDTDVLVPCLGEANWNAAEWGINDYKSAPTLAVAQRWLREVKRYNLESVQMWSHWDYCWHFTDPNHLWEKPKERFKTYEEALEAGIKKALEIILEKGE